MLKKCNTCGKILDLDMFYFNANKKVYKNRCVNCESLIRQKRYNSKKAKFVDSEPSKFIPSKNQNQNQNVPSKNQNVPSKNQNVPSKNAPIKRDIISSNIVAPTDSDFTLSIYPEEIPRHYIPSKTVLPTPIKPVVSPELSRLVKSIAKSLARLYKTDD